jgi:hypothetical protein
MSGLYYLIPEVWTYAGTNSDARSPAHGVCAIGPNYIATFAFGNAFSAPSTFVAISSASDSVNDMLGSHGTDIITAPYMISAILVKRAKA